MNLYFYINYEVKANNLKGIVYVRCMVAEKALKVTIKGRMSTKLQYVKNEHCFING